MRPCSTRSLAFQGGASRERTSPRSPREVSRRRLSRSTRICGRTGSFRKESRQRPADCRNARPVESFEVCFSCRAHDELLVVGRCDLHRRRLSSLHGRCALPRHGPSGRRLWLPREARTSARDTDVRTDGFSLPRSDGRLLIAAHAHTSSDRPSWNLGTSNPSMLDSSASSTTRVLPMSEVGRCSTRWARRVCRLDLLPTKLENDRLGTTSRAKFPSRARPYPWSPRPGAQSPLPPSTLSTQRRPLQPKEWRARVAGRAAGASIGSRASISLELQSM